jgi:hypothetical protein
MRPYWAPLDTQPIRPKLGDSTVEWKDLYSKSTIAAASDKIWTCLQIHMNVDLISFPWSTWTPKIESRWSRGIHHKLPRACSPNPALKRVGFDIFLSLSQKWCGGLVEDVGNTWIWSPINFFGLSCLPCVFNTLFGPCMYFWKCQWTHIMVQHQFIKWITYNHDKELFHLWIKICQYGCIRAGDVLIMVFASTTTRERRSAQNKL